MNEHLNYMKKVNRSLTAYEQICIAKLLSKPFCERDVLLAQVSRLEVVGECDCGCLTIDLNIDSKQGMIRYAGKELVPVEMEVMDKGCPVLFLLHTKNGYISELEILRADSNPIDSLPNIETAVISVR